MCAHYHTQKYAYILFVEKESPKTFKRLQVQAKAEARKMSNTDWSR